MNQDSRPRPLWRRWAGCAMLASASACGDTGTAGPDGWVRLLQGQLDPTSQPACWRVEFPLQLGPQQVALREPLRQMVRAGLLVEHDHVEQVPLSRTGQLWQPTPRFELTDRGRRLYRQDLEPAAGAPRSGLCFERPT